MTKEHRKMLDDEIAARIGYLDATNAGNDTDKEAIEQLTKLCKIANDADKIESDFADTVRKATDDIATHKEMKKERYCKIGIAAAEIIIPLVFYGIWFKRGLKFEETGAFTSTTFKGLINRFRPTKK